MTLEPLTDEILAELPVFPLPATVLFPGTALPLHVFEPRYRAMVEDAMADHRAIAIAMLHDDADPMDEHAPIYPVACAGRIVHEERLSNGRYNILVHGLERVRLEEEFPLLRGYRRFRTHRLSTTDIDEAGPELARLHSCVLSLRDSVAQTDEQLVEVLKITSDPEQLADILSAVLVTDPHLRQELLACESLKVRLSVLVDAVAEVMIRVGEPPQATKMN